MTDPRPKGKARWRQRPPGSTWADFGPEDEIGRLNLLTEERVLAAVAEVRRGKRFCLSLPLDYPGGSVVSKVRRPPQLSPETLPDGQPAVNVRLSDRDPLATDVFNDDRVTLSLQYSTHWDSLAHVGQQFDVSGEGRPEPVYYNGFHADRDLAAPSSARDPGGYRGVERLGIENMAAACVQGRGVMVDIEAHLGRNGETVGYDGLMRIIDADRLEIEEGDFVCLRTGFAQLLLEMRRRPDRDVLFGTTAALDGRDERLQRWISDSGIVALIADNYAVERLPAERPADTPCATLPLHEHCLFRLGVYLGELWHLSELADWLRANHRSRFLLTAPPLRLPGAVASPTTPIATV